MGELSTGSGMTKSRYREHSKWPTPDTQMALCWAEAQNLIYSGSTAGTVHAWSIEEREQKTCLEGHSDIVMEVGGCFGGWGASGLCV